MAGIDENGLTTKRYEDILSGLEESLRSYFGNNLDLSEDALLGIINIIYANALTEQWEMAEAVYNAFNIDTATGKQLDDLVALIGLSRLDESATTGIVELTGVSGTTVPVNTEFRTSDTDIPVYTNNLISITSSNCMRAVINLDTILDNNEYIINVGGTQYTYTSDATATSDEILTGIKDSINFDINASWNATFTLGDTFLVVEADQISYPMSVFLGDNFSLGDVTSIGSASHNVVGDVLIFADTVTVIPTAIAGLVSITNSLAFNTGRFEETDDELRLRHSISTSVLGSSSPDAIQAKVAAIDGVTYSQVFENTTLFTDSRGLPPKSFEAVVDGGTDAVIAALLYSEKPAGIETHGNTVVATTDTDGKLQAVKFTRPVSVLIYVDVNYTIYDEEVFPTNGEELIKQAVALHSESLLLGEDVIAQRIYGTIFSNISGIQSLDIKLGFDSGSVTSVVLPIAEEERGLILEGNVTVGLG